MAKRKSPRPTPSFSNRSKGLVETVDHECLIWPDIENSSLRELIKLSPSYSPGRSPSLDTSFEAAVVSAGNTPLKKLTIADATALTSALVNNIKATPSGYEAHYTPVLKQVWRNLTNTTNAASPTKGHASFSELSRLIVTLDDIAPRELPTPPVATAAPLDSHMKQDINIMANCISQISMHMHDKDAREESFLNSVLRKRLSNARVFRDKNLPGNTYTIVFSAPSDPSKSLLDHALDIREFFIDHDITVGGIRSNGILMSVMPEKDSVIDRALQALNKEGKMIR